MSAPKVEAVAAECRRYAGPALRPLLAPRRGRAAGVELAEELADSASRALEAGDREGTRLARMLLLLSPAQRADLRRRLSASPLTPQELRP